MYNLAQVAEGAGVPSTASLPGPSGDAYGFPGGMQATCSASPTSASTWPSPSWTSGWSCPRRHQVATQNTYYTNVVQTPASPSRAAWASPSGLPDKYSWVPSTFSGEGTPPGTTELVPKADYKRRRPRPGRQPHGEPTTSPTTSASCRSPTPPTTGAPASPPPITITDNGSPLTAWTLGLRLHRQPALTTGWSGNWTQSRKNVTSPTPPGTAASHGRQRVRRATLLSGTNTAPGPPSPSTARPAPDPAHRTAVVPWTAGVRYAELPL